MSGTIKATNIQDGASSTVNLALDASGNVTVGNNLTVSGTGVLNIGSGQVYKDSSGNVGIGTTSPNGTLTINKPNTSNGTVFLNGATTGADFMRLKNTSADGVFGIAGSGGTEIMLGGLAYATQIYTVGSTALQFGTASNARATIDSSGNLLVGTTNASISAGSGFKLLPSGSTTLGVVGADATSSTNCYHLYSTNAGAYRFYVGYDGVVHATSTSISAISDASLKTNVKPLETGLAEVMALQPRRFDWINGDGTNVAGFIAQEVETVLPDLVTDAIYNETETKKNLKMGDMIPTLVKALQEAAAKIDALETRITQLESK